MPERERKIFEITTQPLPDTIPFSLVFVRTLDDGTSQREVHDFDAVCIDLENDAGANLAMAAIVVFDAARGKQVMDLNGILRFFDRVLPDNDYSRLKMLLDSKAHVIEIDQLAEVFNYVVKEMTGRPTPRSLPSSNGQSTAGPLSTVPPS